MKRGKVWLVGAGPSDPGLLTLKGKAVLVRAEVVVYDRLVGDGVLAMAPADALKIDAGKNAGNHTLPQEEINRLLIGHAKEGKRVVRLKGGDPFLFGRGGEEAEALAKAGIPFEVVPGVTAATAVPAYFGIPVTHREEASSLHLITAHRKAGKEQPLDYKALAALGPQATLVFFMGVGALEEICTGLIEAGMSPDTPAAVLEKGTAAGQRKAACTLSTLPEEANRLELGTPGLIVVGEVCRLSEQLSWAESRPLGGARVFVTRPREKAAALSDRLSQLGAEVIELPAIRTEVLEPCSDLLKRKVTLQSYQWLVCSSPVGAEAFFSFLHHERIDIRSLPGLRFAAVGEKTKAALEERGILVDCCPAEFNGKALAEELLRMVSPGDRILALVPENRESAAATALQEAGADVETAVVYRTVYEKNLIVPRLNSNDYAVFTSASTVRGFAALYSGQPLSQVRAICIGEQTAAAAVQYSMNPVVAEHAAIESLIEKVVEIHTQERSETK